MFNHNFFNKKIILIKDDIDLSGKGCDKIENFLHCESISIKKSKNIDYDKYKIFIFHFSETRSKNIENFKLISRSIKNKHPDKFIYNDPDVCDIGDKYSTLCHLRNQKGIDNIEIPKFWKIEKISDIEKVSFPCILKLPRCSNPIGKKADCLVNDEKQWIKTYDRLINYYPYILCMEFIGSQERIYKSVRFHSIKNKLLDYYCRPSKKWNIHTKDQEVSKILHFEKKFKIFFHQLNFDNILFDIKRIFGLGWHVMDCVWSQKKLYFCEIGYKIYDRSYIDFVNNKKINVEKLNEKKILKLINIEINNGIS